MQIFLTMLAKIPEFPNREKGSLNILSNTFCRRPSSLAVDNKPDIATCTVTNGKNVSLEFFDLNLILSGLPTLC